MDGDLLRPRWPVFSVSKYLDRVKKIPRVAMNNAET